MHSFVGWQFRRKEFNCDLPITFSGLFPNCLAARSILNDFIRVDYKNHVREVRAEIWIFPFVFGV